MDLKGIGSLRGAFDGCRGWLLLAILVMLLGCSREPPKSAAGALDTSVSVLLKELTATDEARR
ncbi:MAG: hypothetical protein P8010_11810, partial [Desulfosarcinaceae bacterium]